MKANFETGLKICSKCRRELPLDSFPKDKHSSDGFCYQCKDCNNERNKCFNKTEKGRESHIQSQRKYEKTEKGKQCNGKFLKKYRSTEKGKLVQRSADLRFIKTEKGKQTKKRALLNWKERGGLREWRNNQYKNNVNYKISVLVRNRIGTALENNIKSQHTLNLLGCSIEEFRKHIESQFQNGMTWDNQGEWHLDHIIPCAYFDLSDPEQQRICFNYQNYQPLWASENCSKSNKVPENVEELVEFLKQEIT